MLLCRPLHTPADRPPVTSLLAALRACRASSFKVCTKERNNFACLLPCKLGAAAQQCLHPQPRPVSRPTLTLKCAFTITKRADQ
jgi:hypothetical protein